MKVITDYEDGRFSMRKAGDTTHLATVEISRQEWDEYQQFLALERRWHTRIQELDNRRMAEYDSDTAAREVDNRPSEVIVRELRGEWPDHYAENPPHGAPGHRLSRNCDQCVENGS